MDLTRKWIKAAALLSMLALLFTGTASLRHLLNHQSGIPTWEFQKDWIRKGRGDQMELGYVWGKAETLEYCTGDLLPETNKPGQRYSYSNTNYTILGLII